MKRVAIIGGGPAGLTAAIEGAKNGLNVTLYEKYKIGDDIRCAEGFFDTLNVLGQPKYAVKCRVQEIKLRIKSDYSFPCDDKINIWVMDRREWQRGLANEARALGVNIIENFPISRDNFKEITAQYEWVIDSTGVPSVTSIAYGFNKYYSDTSVITAQYTMEGDFTNLYGKVKMVFEDSYTGYCWVFPKSTSEANVGIGFLKNNSLHIWDELERVIEKEGLSTYKRTKKIGGLCPIKKLDRLVYENILLTGDAAGLTSPLHGGGIDTACISGTIAMQCILNNRVDRYESEIENALGHKLKGENEVQEFWKLIDFSVFDFLIKLCNDAHIKLSYCGFFNGNFGLFRKLKHFKFLLTPIKIITKRIFSFLS